MELNKRIAEPLLSNTTPIDGKQGSSETGAGIPWAQLHMSREYHVTHSPSSRYVPPNIMQNNLMAGLSEYYLDGGLSLPLRSSLPTSLRGRPRVLYDQHRCRVLIPPLSIALFSVTLIVLGVLLLVPGLGLRSALDLTTITQVDGVLIVAVSLIGLGFVLPLLLLCICVKRATPSRAERERAACKADAILESLTAPAELDEHYDVHGPENSAHGVVVMLAGPSCPRITMSGFAEALSVYYKTICIDLPGQGSLVNVQFSLASSERVLARVLERELNLVAGQLSMSSNIVDNATTQATSTTPTQNIPIASRGDRRDKIVGNTSASQASSYTSNQQGLSSTPVEIMTSAFEGVNHNLYRILEGASENDEQRRRDSQAPQSHRAKSVVLISYGASAYVAAYFANRNPDLIAGLALVGPVPDYNVPRCCTGAWESLYRLRWAASLANFHIKSKIRTHPKLPEQFKKELLAYDWHVSALPDFITEVSGRELITNLRNFPRDIMILAPATWGAKAAIMFSASTNPAARFQITLERGLSDDKLPTFNPAKLPALTSHLTSFCGKAISAHEQRLLRAYAAAAAASNTRRTLSTSAHQQQTGRTASTGTDLFSPNSPGIPNSASLNTRGSLSTAANTTSAAAAEQQRRSMTGSAPARKSSHAARSVASTGRNSES